MKNSYSVEGVELVVRDNAGAILWRGPVDAHAVKHVVLTADLRGACVVLLDPDSKLAGRFQNVVCVDSTGDIRWRAELPGSQPNDCYVQIESKSGSLFATSWSGLRVEIDTKTGAIVTERFVK